MVRHWARTAAVMLVTCLTIACTMDLEINAYDEGIVLTDALRAGAGQLVHRDYYANYAPGSSYMVALIFAFVGRSALTALLYGVAVMAGIATMVFALLAGRVRPVLAIIGAAAITCWMIANPAYLYPSLPCALLTLVATAMLVRPGALAGTWLLLLAGGCAGLATCFRYDTGFFMALAHCVAIAICLWLRGSAHRWHAILRGCLLYGAGAALVFVPFAILFLSVASFGRFYEDVVAYGLYVYPHTRLLPFPMPWTALAHPGRLGVYFPIVAVLCALPVVIADARDDVDGGLPLSLGLSCLTVLLCYKGLVSPVVVHMLMAIVPAVPLAMIAADRYLSGRMGGRAIAILLTGLAIAPAAYAAERAVLGTPVRRTPLQRMFAAAPAPGSARWGEDCAALPHMRGVVLKPPYARAGRFLATHSRPGEAVYVGLARHDRIFANPIALYFVADRPPVTRWAQFDPGLQTRADVQTRMVDELRVGRPRWAVRDDSDEMQEPARTATSGARLVDAYLDAHYRPVAHTDKVALWLRKDKAAPRLDIGPAECRLTP